MEFSNEVCQLINFAMELYSIHFGVLQLKHHPINCVGTTHYMIIAERLPQYCEYGSSQRKIHRTTRVSYDPKLFSKHRYPEMELLDSEEDGKKYKNLKGTIETDF